MSLDSRVEKLMPGLSARERAILILRSHKAGTPPDPLLRRTMPNEQIPEFNRLIGLMNGCNMHLPLFITMIEGWAAQMEVRVFWWQTMVGYGSALWELGKFIPPEMRLEAEAAVEKHRPSIELPWDTDEHEASWLNVADAMQQEIREGVAHLWDDLKAIDAVIAEAAAPFGGEDPLRPVMRGVLEKARRTLSALHASLSGEEAAKITEPSEEALELARTYFKRGMNPTS